MKVEDRTEWLERAEILKSYRHAQGITLKEMAKIAGVSAPTLGKLEKGERVRRHVLVRLAPLIRAWLATKWV